MTERLIKSKSKEPIIVACIYLACRMEQYPRTLDELGAGTGIPVRTINTMQQIIRENLGLQIGPLRPEQLVGRMVSRMRCAHVVRQCAEEMCASAACSHVLEGTPPQVTAAMTIVVAALLAGQTVEVDLLTSVAGLTFTRVQIVYRKIYPVLSAVVPDKFTHKVRIADMPATLEQVAKDGKVVVAMESRVASRDASSKDGNAVPVPVPVVGRTRSGSVGSATGTSGVKRKGEGEEAPDSKKKL
jgi:hypothetical protein